MTGKLHLSQVVDEEIELSEHRTKTRIDHSATDAETRPTTDIRYLLLIYTRLAAVVL